MSHAKNKVEWCLKKAEKELKESSKHRGLIKVEPNPNKVEEYIKKADHNLNAAIYFAKTKYSDWSANAFFYSIYHCLLAIAAKFGYESSNQECTLALMYYLAEEGKINIKKELLDKITSLDVEKSDEKSIVEEREYYQYGIKLSIDTKTYEELLEFAKEIISETKEIIEK